MFENEYQKDLKLREFAKTLFQMWDERGMGKIKIIHLVKNFIALGLSANEDIAISFFRNLI